MPIQTLDLHRVCWLNLVRISLKDEEFIIHNVYYSLHSTNPSALMRKSFLAVRKGLFNNYVVMMRGEGGAPKKQQR